MYDFSPRLYAVYEKVAVMKATQQVALIEDELIREQFINQLCDELAQITQGECAAVARDLIHNHGIFLKALSCDNAQSSS